ncbi:hypothetical protein MLD38_011713 [Melastoma candidum]|uniref:Uncharacterized protein n=1 Tax=Melastoma candidum TaxID=119954 RepID=A0ACB9R3Y8_9MYRT|nr:hypothetical protein MLD38_011713 [Melastoma candidum]
MPESDGSSRPLFGGAVSTTFPLSFQDVSEVRQVPDHQEVFADPWRDQSLIFELLELKQDVEDHGSAVWFLQDIAAVQDAGQCTLLEQSGVVEAPWLVYQSTPAVISTVIGQMSISKGRQGRDAQNVGRVRSATEGSEYRYVDHRLRADPDKPLERKRDYRGFWVGGLCYRSWCHAHGGGLQTRSFFLKGARLEPVW